MKSLLEITAHRPWLLPRGPWIIAQGWHDLLFAHWPIAAEKLRALIPAALQIDTFEGQAWIAVVPFRMSGVRLRWTPVVPGLSAFPELNVRTYVVRDGKPGVWFFSLDAGNPLAVAIARAWFHLPYFRARMLCEPNNGGIRYRSQRTHRAAPPALLHCSYRPTGNALNHQVGSLEYFLTERYCLYAADNAGRLFRGEIHHPPWSLQPAESEIAANTVAEAAGVRLPLCQPLLHFSKRQDMVAWSPQLVTS